MSSDDGKLEHALAVLKEHLRENETAFHWTSDWNGDTEGGFYSQEEFDFNALLNQIDEFAKTFLATSPARTPAACPVDAAQTPDT